MRIKTGLFVLAAAGAAVLAIACTTQKAQALPLNNVVGSFNPDVAYTPRSGTTTKSVYGSTSIPKSGSSTSKNTAKSNTINAVKAAAAHSIHKVVPTVHNPAMVGPFTAVNAKTVSVNSYQTVKSVGNPNAVSPVHTVNPYQAVDILKSLTAISAVPAPHTSNQAAGSIQNVEQFGYYYGHYNHYHGYSHYWGYYGYGHYHGYYPYYNHQ